MDMIIGILGCIVGLFLVLLTFAGTKAVREEEVGVEVPILFSFLSLVMVMNAILVIKYNL